MTEERIATKVTISRNSRDEIVIYVKDDLSRARFLEITLTPEQYGYLISGLSEIECNSLVRDLDVVGKTKISEQREVITLKYGYDRKYYEQWILDNCLEHGWIVNNSLNSQTSITYINEVPEKVKLRYSVFKYV